VTVVECGSDAIGDGDQERAAIVAMNNAALPPDDPRKITRETVRTIRLARALCPKGGVADRELSQIANALEAYLPPVALISRSRAQHRPGRHRGVDSRSPTIT